MPSPKRKTRRNPLQRLNDQRRSLALVGLAVGAVFSAAIFRRRRRGVEAEPGLPEPLPTEPFAAAEPEVAAAANVATASQADQEAPEAAAASISDPATGELSAEEASILAVLAQHGRADDDRTVIAVATSLERETADVTEVLRKLGAEGVVAGELYTATGDKIWAVTERGVRRLGAQH